jgi:hypothetical protein
MKKLLILLVLLVSGLGYSQSHNDTLEKWYNENRLAVEKEFVRLIDSARSSIIIEKLFGYTSLEGYSQKELKSIKKEEKSKGNHVQVVKEGSRILSVFVTKHVPVVKMEYDSILSMASNHHAEYLRSVGSSRTLDHQEFKDFYGTPYEGDLPILLNPTDRVKYYCPNRVYVGECNSMGRIGHIATLTRNAAINYWVKNIDNVNVESVAKFFFDGFKNSPKHWDAFMGEDDIDLMGVSFIMNFDNDYVNFVSVFGKDKSKINNDLFAKQ